MATAGQREKSPGVKPKVVTDRAPAIDSYQEIEEEKLMLLGGPLWD